MASLSRALLLIFVLAAWSGAPATAQDDGADRDTPDWQSFSEAVDAAAESGKKILVDVYVPWCPWCQRLEEEVHADPDVLAYLEANYELARLNVDEEEETHTYQGRTLTTPELARQLYAQGFPTTVFLESDGTFITRLPGFVEADIYLQALRFIDTEAFREQTFEEFIGHTE